MPEAAGKRCLVAIDLASGPLIIELHLPAVATIDDALAQARRVLAAGGEHRHHAAASAAIDWAAAATGIWGERRERGAVPREGDRIELYRPLAADPRQQRRTRARNHGKRA
ncbi:MAG: RnfH family protein [Proteobacteria bacterium]|nr:RnfH family protein [Pseudomonadota bacterium]